MCVVYACVHIQVQVCVCLWRTEVSLGYFSISLLPEFFSLSEFLRQGLLLSLELTESAILAIQGAPGILLSSKDYRHMPPYSSYMDAGDLNVSPHAVFPVPKDYVFA